MYNNPSSRPRSVQGNPDGKLQMAVYLKVRSMYSLRLIMTWDVEGTSELREVWVVIWGTRMLGPAPVRVVQFVTYHVLAVQSIFSW